MKKIVPCPDAERLLKCLSENRVFMALLKALYFIEPSAYLAAGVIRNSIWAHLHDQHYALNRIEVDVIFFNPQDNGYHEQRIQKYLEAIFPKIIWDVTNQALVHQWYQQENGEGIAPLTSIAHALSLWPETATAVAVRLNAQDHLEFEAPLGLQDLFELNLRWNSALVSQAVFMERIQTKQFLEKWPLLTLVPPHFTQ
ncbi:nucleotidyltransferase family protein [Acinetobacter celticus]|uniref:nucleotidyltransferase family protein n=1 Tax=Acinetobacter celticus TaxID=1891224 RepID=UPI000A8A8CEE|nr:nucleotidyltransferase family protein [Acinetobacter celticus]